MSKKEYISVRTVYDHDDNDNGDCEVRSVVFVINYREKIKSGRKRANNLLFIGKTKNP